MKTSEIVAMLQGVRGGPPSWTARCPAHEDRAPSLSISEADDGRTLMKCHAGCETGAVLAALGISERDLFPSANGNGKHAAGEKSEYPVRDAAGKVIAVHVRVDRPEGKLVYWTRPGGGRGLGGRKLSDLPLYELPSLLATPQTLPVVVTEGEPKADILQRLVGEEAVVVGTVTGAEALPGDEALRPLVGRTVYLWPDHDAPGARHMARIAAALLRLGGTAPRMIAWADAKEPGDDAADFVKRGGTLEAFRRLLTEAKPWAPEPSVADAPGGEPAEDARHLTDCGNAERLIARHGEDLRYCWTWRKWLSWDGRRWRLDAGAEVEALAKETVRSIYAEAAVAENRHDREEIAKHARASESAGRLQAMIDLARSERGIPVKPEELDQDPWLLNCLNGTVDLRTGELRPHRREDLITKLVPIEYHPEAKASRWERFLLEIMDNKPHLVDYLRRVAGYAATGDVREQVLFFLHGGGCNGKTTFLNAIREVLGPDYAIEALPELLLAKHGEAHPTERAHLHGKRFVSTVEVEDGRRFAEVQVKQLTGGDEITARRMREDPWSFRPTHKLFLAANHKPEIRGTDRAIWRRIRLIPFTVSFEGRADKDLPAKLAEEREGILAWIVRGAVEWSVKGLEDPPEVLAAVEEYRSEMDSLGEFLRDCCVTGSDSYRAKAGALYEAFVEWHQAERGGEPDLTATAFGRRLAEKYRKVYDRTGTWYVGVGIDGEKGGIR